MANRYVFAADGSQLQQEAKKSTTELRTMQGELKKLEAQSKATHKELVLQAKASGASSEELRQLQQKQFGDQLAFNAAKKQITADSEAAGRKMVKSEEDKAKAIARATEELKRQRAEVEKLTRAPREEHLEPTARQKAGALVRGGGLRSAEAFAATIPGFANFAAAVFPVVGGIALLADASTKVAELREKLREAREAGMRLREGFEGISAPIETSVDTLRKQNAELEISIAKLLHKPENGLKLAVAETALEVDHLADRARSAYNDVSKLLKEQKVGLLGQLLDQGSTSESSNLVQGGFRDIADRTRDYKNAVRSSGPDSQQSKDAAAALQQRRDRLRSDLRELQGKINGTEEVDQTGAYGVKTKVRISYAQAHGDQTAQRNIIGGALDVLDNQDDEDTERKRNALLTGQQKQIELQRSAATAAREAASKAKEAAHKAAEEQRKQWDDDLAAMESSGRASADAIHRFWVDRSNEAAVGTENYQAAEKKSFESLRTLNVEKAKLLDEGIKLREAFGREGMKDALALVMPGIGANAKGAEDAARTARTLKEQQQDAALSIAEANVQYALQAGQISKADAAVQMQTLHTMQYEQAMARLREQMDAVRDGPEAEAQRNTLQAQMVQLDTRRATEVLQDGASVAATSWRDALKKANADWVVDSKDSAQQVVSLYGQILGGTNQNIVRGIMGERTDVTGMLKGVGGNIADIGVRRLESLGLQKLQDKFGLAKDAGKPDGSRGKAFYVNVINGSDGKSADSLLPSPATLTSMFGGKGGGSSLMDSIGGIASDAALSFLPGGSLLSSLFGGFRAFGGGIDEGKGYIVGEKGPEWFSPGRSGYITPNNRMQEAFGGNAYYSISVGNGVTPEEFHRTMNSKLAEWHPRVVRDSVHAVTEGRMRSAAPRM